MNPRIALAGSVAAFVIVLVLARPSGSVALIIACLAVAAGVSTWLVQRRRR